MSYKFKVFKNETSGLLQEFIGNKTILVVDPSSNYRSSIKQFLSNLKIKNVSCVATVKEARRVMVTKKIGLMLVEWLSDEENGLQFCRNIQKELPHETIPYFLLTSENLKHDVILASEIGVNRYIVKPFSYEVFVQQINSLMKDLIHPNPINQTLQKADLALEKEDLAEAEDLFIKAIQINDKSAKAYCGLAKIEFIKENLAKSEEYLKKALVNNPKYIEAHRLLFKTYEKQRNFEGMMQEAMILHDESPENPRYTLILATLYLKEKNLDQSEHFFKLTTKIAPSIAESYKGLGNIAIEKKDYKKARKHFRKAIDLDQNDASTLNSLGLAYVNLGKYEEGIKKYLLALQIQVNDHRIYFNLGQAYEKQKNFEKAQTFYKKSLALDEDFEKAKRGCERVKKALKMS